MMSNIKDESGEALLELDWSTTTYEDEYLRVRILQICEYIARRVWRLFDAQ